MLSRAGRYQVVTDSLSVKEVRLDKRRYLVCFNWSAVEAMGGTRFFTS